jgi:uncharacterized protein YndB with AHSA1/START domain
MMSIAAIGHFTDRNTILFDLQYPHPPSSVWRAITQPEQLAVWFMPMELDLRLGGRVTLDPRDDRSTPTQPAEGVITALEPEALLEYRFSGGQELWPESVLRWELSADGDGSRLVFSQRLAADVIAPEDFDQFAGPGTFAPGTCAGWQGFFQEGLNRFLDGRRAPIYDDTDDELMSARTVEYRQRLLDEVVGLR